MNSEIKISDLHMHGSYSDGKGSLREYAKKASDLGIATVGISDHTPLPLDNCWSMKLSDLEQYLEELEGVKKDFKGRTDVLKGIELDYIDGIDVKGYINFEERDFDYFIGSVHYVYSEILDGYYEVDGPRESFAYLLEEGFAGNIRKLVESYYSNVRKMIETYNPKVVAHIDLIKKNNQDNGYFDESSDWYKKQVALTLAKAKEYRSLVEINTGAISRGYTEVPYPSDYILKECLDQGIGITLNSDAHEPANICYLFDEMMEHACKTGYKEIYFLIDGKFMAIEL